MGLTYDGKTDYKYPIHILWLIYLLLGADRGIGDSTSTIGRQRPLNKRGMVFSAWSAKHQLNSNKETLFSVLSVLRYYKQDNRRE